MKLLSHDSNEFRPFETSKTWCKRSTRFNPLGALRPTATGFMADANMLIDYAMVSPKYLDTSPAHIDS